MPGDVRSWMQAATIAVVVAGFMVSAVDHPAASPATATRAIGSTAWATTASFAALDAPGRASATSGDGGAPGERPGAGHAVPLAAGSAASTFGVLVVDGGVHRCSAAVVASDSRRLLATAAHCVWLGGRWTHGGAYFVPGYRSSSESWGRWAVEAAWVPRSWQEANSPIEDVASAHDVAFVRLAESASGKLPEDVLGSQGIRFDAPTTPTVTALGYPATGAFNGQQLQRCTGAAHVEQALDQTGDGRDGSGTESGVGGEVLVIDCDMTDGASGGPWLVGPRAQSGWGQVVGVISGGSGPELVSARFGPEAAEVYHPADTETEPDEDDRR